MCACLCEWIMLCYGEVSDLTHFQKVILILESGALFQTSSGCRIFQLCLWKLVFLNFPILEERLYHSSDSWMPGFFFFRLTWFWSNLRMTPPQTSWKICTDVHHFYLLIKIEIFKIPIVCQLALLRFPWLFCIILSQLCVKYIGIVASHVRVLMFWDS